MSESTKQGLREEIARIVWIGGGGNADAWDRVKARKIEAPNHIDEKVAEAWATADAITDRFRLPAKGSATSIRLAAESAQLRQALKPFASGGDWGSWFSWLINGAPDRAEGKAAAKQIVRWQVAADEAISRARASGIPVEGGGGDVG